jgi:hypothetical protein
MLTSGSWHLSRKIRTPSTVKTLKPHWSTHSPHGFWQGPSGFPQNTVRVHKTGNGTRRYEGSPGWEAAYFTRMDNTKGMDVDEITIANQLGLDPGSCQVCSTRSQRSRKHWNANEGLSIEMGFTPPNLWPWQVASRSFEAFNASRSFSTAWIAACAGPAGWHPISVEYWDMVCHDKSRILLYVLSILGCQSETCHSRFHPD